MCGIFLVFGTIKLSGRVVFLCYLYTPKFNPMTFLMSLGFSTQCIIIALVGNFRLVLFDCLAFRHEPFLSEFRWDISI
jgi:hypothetical protein